MISLNRSSRLLRVLSAFKTTNVAPLHTTCSRGAVKFARNENVYFKGIYSDDLQFQRLEPIINNKKFVEDKQMASFDNLVKTTRRITSNDLVPFFKTFIEGLKDKDIESLIFVLNRLRESKFDHMSASMHCLISFLDQKLADYLESQTVITNEQFETLFQTALLFDEIGLQSWSKFIRQLAKKPLDHFELFENKDNLMRLLYIWNLSREQMACDKALLIELQIVKFFHFNQLDLKDCGLICLGFHKTQTKFQSNLIEQITEKLINESGTLDDPICLVSILKGIYSADYKIDRDLLNKLKNRLLDESQFRDNFLVLTKLLAIEKKYRYYDEKLIQQTLDAFARQDSVRIKELSRLLLNLLFFNVQLNSRQIGKFNELFEHFKSNFVIYRIEYLLSVFALASHGLIRKEEIYNIFAPEFIKILRTKYNDINYFFINLNNIIKLYGDVNYRNVALKDEEILHSFKNFNSLTKQNVYARFKKFDHYPSKLYLTYQTLKESLQGRVHLIHVMPGVRYPSIVITPTKTTLKDYPFEVGVNVANGHVIVQVPSTEIYCDRAINRVNGFYKLESDLFVQMGFKLFKLDNQRISHNLNELKEYIQEEVIDKLESTPSEK